MNSLHTRTGMLAAAVTGLLVGSAMVSTKAVSGDLSSGTLALWRYVIGAGLLAVPSSLVRLPRFSLQDAGAIMVLGIFQFAVLMLLLNYALARLSATTCALVFSTMPLFAMGWSIAAGKETFRVLKFAGLLLAVSGVSLLLGLPETTPEGGSSTLGFSALITATLIGAVTSVMYGPFLARYSALHTSGLAMIAAVIFLILYCLVTAQPLVPTISSIQWANLCFIGLSSGLGYFCWLWALTKLEPSRVVAFQALGPITAAAVEIFTGSRFMTFELASSLVMVTTGLALAMWQSPGKRPEHDPSNTKELSDQC